MHNWFLTKSWLPSSTCERAPAQDPLRQYLPNQSGHQRYGSKLHECHHPKTIRLPRIECFQESVSVQKVSTTDRPKSLSSTIAICETIDTHPSTTLLKVLFDSGSTKTMIHFSALPTEFQCISYLSSLKVLKPWWEDNIKQRCWIITMYLPWV